MSVEGTRRPTWGVKESPTTFVDALVLWFSSTGPLTFPLRWPHSSVPQIRGYPKTGRTRIKSGGFKEKGTLVLFLLLSDVTTPGLLLDPDESHERSVREREVGVLEQ